MVDGEIERWDRMRETSHERLGGIERWTANGIYRDGGEIDIHVGNYIDI